MPSAPFELPKCGLAFFPSWYRRNLKIEEKNAAYLLSTNTDAGYKHKDHNHRKIPHFSNTSPS
jgi:hypothetical protein